jgi:hypothetical protein
VPSLCVVVVAVRFDAGQSIFQRDLPAEPAPSRACCCPPHDGARFSPAAASKVLTSLLVEVADERPIREQEQATTSPLRCTEAL